MGDKFVAAVKREYAPGIIGPFSLQSVITKDLELIVYDVSLRVPGNSSSHPKSLPVLVFGIWASCSYDWISRNS